MTPIETASLIASAAVLVIGIPIAAFHREIAKELRHLREHFFDEATKRESKHGHRHHG